MFEKLKEYGLYIILGLIALGALAYAYVQTSNSQKGAEIHEANLDAMVTNLAKSDKLKKTSTVADNLLNANGGKTIGKYKIDSSKVSYVIGETYEDIFENKQMLDISADVADVEDGQLRTVLIAKPAVQVNGNDVNTVNLNSDKSLTIGNNTISKDDLKDVADELKGYNISAIGYTSFDTEQEAKDFRDTYFSNYEVYQIGNTGKYVVLTEYNDGGSNNVNDKVNTQTRDDLLTLNNGTGNQQNNEPQQTEEEILVAQVATIKSNLFDEVTDLQTYLTSQGLNSTNNSTIDDMINQVIAKINGINGTNKDEKNTEIQNDIATIQSLIDSLKAEEHNQEVTNAKNSLTTKKNEAVTLLDNTNLSNSNKSSAQNRINTVTTNINNLTYETLNTVSSIETEINSIKDFINNNAVVCEGYQEFSNGACQTAIYLDSNGITMKATNYAVAGKEYTLSGTTYYVAKDGIKLDNGYHVGCYDVQQKINNGYPANRIITSRCTSFNVLFYENTTFNQNISNWDTSNVTNMRMMFSSANAFNQPIGIWDVSNVTDMTQMFWNGRTGSNMTFNQDLSNWNTSNVTNMYTMFYQYNPTLLQNMNISSWNVSKVTNCEHFLNRNTGKPNYFPNFTNCTPGD